jgi:ABC-type bacteriocin/lantibiotic exporter with double-glycine peptidase domain
MIRKKRYIGIAVVVLAAGIVNSSRVLHPLIFAQNIPDEYAGGEYQGTDGVLMQSSYNDCGPAVLQMIFDRYGIVSSVGEIERTVRLTGSGASMFSLKQMAEEKGLRAEGWRLTLGDLTKASFPLLLFVHNDHFVVADSIDNSMIFLRDPAIGRIKLPALNLPQIWRGETLIIAKK